MHVLYVPWSASKQAGHAPSGAPPCLCCAGCWPKSQPRTCESTPFACSPLTTSGPISVGPASPPAGARLGSSRRISPRVSRRGRARRPLLAPAGGAGASAVLPAAAAAWGRMVVVSSSPVPAGGGNECAVSSGRAVRGRGGPRPPVSTGEKDWPISSEESSVTTGTRVARASSSTCTSRQAGRQAAEATVRQAGGMSRAEGQRGAP